jgi:hypothetical protein
MSPVHTSQGTTDPSTLCERAVAAAESIGRLPPRLLGAISLIETGRVDPASGRVRAWPWTINAAGAGQFFETRQQAVAAVKALRVRGISSIDVGCLQVNLMYHPRAFATVEEAFDPWANAEYASRFLNVLHGDSKDWAVAVAAYHSETPALGNAYRSLVMPRWQNGAPHTLAEPGTVYGDFAHSAQVYGAFAPSSRVYRAFAQPTSGR